MMSHSEKVRILPIVTLIKLIDEKIIYEVYKNVWKRIKYYEIIGATKKVQLFFGIGKFFEKLFKKMSDLPQSLTDWNLGDH